MGQRVRKAVFPVAGMGTRFRTATEAMPKERLPVIDKPLIQYAVKETLAAGSEELIVVTGRHKRAIEDRFDAAPQLEAALASRQQHELLQRRPVLAHRFYGRRFDCGTKRGYWEATMEPGLRDAEIGQHLQDTLRRATVGASGAG